MSEVGVSVRDRAVYLDAAEVLVVADLHVGRDEASSVQFPLGERSDLRDRLASLCSYFSPETVVFAGDIVHTFGDVSVDSERAVRDLVDACRDAGAEPVIVAGNHDAAFLEAWDGRAHEEYLIDGCGGDRRTVVCHGHDSPDTEAERYVVGHDHPTIEIEGVRHPCFLHGEGVYAGADVWMLPAFNRLAPGVVVNGMTAAAFRSPLVTDADAFRPVVWDPDTHETLRFPPLGEFRGLL